MTAALTDDQQRLIKLATEIAKQDIIVRRADITEMVSIIRRLQPIDQRKVIEQINDPQALRYLSTAGISQDARARLHQKLQELAALGIK